MNPAPGNVEGGPSASVELPDAWRRRLLLGGLWLYGLFCGFSISGSQIALGIALIGLVGALRNGSVRVKRSIVDWPFACFALAGLLSIGNAEDVGRAVAEMKKFLIIVVFWIPFCANLSPGRQRNVLGVMLCGGALAAVSGILKLIYHDEWATRAYGFFSLPITFGECQMLFALSALAWLLASDSRPLVRIGLLGAFFANLIGMLVSFSRGSWIGFLAGFTIMAWRNPRKLAPLAVLFLAGILIATFVSSGVRTRLASFNFQDNFFRFRIWQVGFDILDLHPVFGVGMNNVKKHYQERARAFDRAANEVHGHLHNTFMQILVMTGLFGFTMFWWMVVVFARFCTSLPLSIGDPWQAKLSEGAFPILIAFLVTGLTEYSFGDEEVAMLTFFLVGFLASPYSPPPETVSETCQGNRIPTDAT